MLSEGILPQCGNIVNLPFLRKILCLVWHFVYKMLWKNSWTNAIFCYYTVITARYMETFIHLFTNSTDFSTTCFWFVAAISSINHRNLMYFPLFCVHKIFTGNYSIRIYTDFMHIHFLEKRLQEHLRTPANFIVSRPK